ncbi:site-specific integrase [Segetibacter koreensis]|uniref:site-specific integrase n=1 Tax=Segetibacter koreensis TaxID=398037 RepID=UPI0003789A9C|nr:site-specific integrase [Segetibacter koreensis]
MEIYKPTATLFLDNRKVKKDGRYPVKLSIYCSPDKKRYSTGYDLTKQEWEKIHNDRLRDDNLKEIKLKLNYFKENAQAILNNLQPFSFYGFEEQFFKTAKTKADLSLATWFDEYIKNLKAEGRIGTAISYRTTINSINLFKPNMLLQDVTPAFLKSYEMYMTELKKSPSTTGIYLRQLRAIINKAIDANILKQENYAFKKFEIPAGRNIKKALSEGEIKKLLQYKPVDSRQQKALDFWIFSYLCNGMNFTDILHLKPENVSEHFIYFIREKTKRTRKKDLQPIKVGLNQRAVEILGKWKNTDSKKPYLFPVLEEGITATTVKHRCQRFIKWVNKHMEDIRIDLEIKNKVGTYVARHTFSTVLKRKHIPISYIKEALGHSTNAITESYLGSFADEVKIENAFLLTDFE